MADFVRQMSRRFSRVDGGRRGKRSRRGPRFQVRRWVLGTWFIFLFFFTFCRPVKNDDSVVGDLVFLFFLRDWVDVL
jgi:hypothetical protein